MFYTYRLHSAGCYNISITSTSSWTTLPHSSTSDHHLHHHQTQWQCSLRNLSKAETKDFLNLSEDHLDKTRLWLKVFFSWLSTLHTRWSSLHSWASDQFLARSSQGSSQLWIPLPWSVYWSFSCTWSSNCFLKKQKAWKWPACMKQSRQKRAHLKMAQSSQLSRRRLRYV